LTVKNKIELSIYTYVYNYRGEKEIPVLALFAFITNVTFFILVFNTSYQIRVRFVISYDKQLPCEQYNYI